MTKQINFLLILCVLIVAQTTNAQNYVPAYLQNASEYLSNSFTVTDSSGWLTAKRDVTVPFLDFIQDHKQDFGLGMYDSLALKRKRTDDFPFTTSENRLMHNFYQQYYKGIKVEYAEFFIHHKDSNAIRTINCKLVEGLSASTTPAIAEAQALTSAINHLGINNTYIWQDSASESIVKIDNNDSTATYYPVGELIFAKVGSDKDYSSSNFRLAWKFEITTVAPEYTYYDIYIDAANGSFIKKVSKMHSDGPAELLYYGSKTIDTKAIPSNT